MSAWLSTLETVIIIPPNTGRCGQGSSVSRYSPDEDWTGCAGVRVFRVTSATNYRSMSGDCETLLSPAAVIKAIRDKFPTRALYSMAQTRHPANKGVIKTVIGNRDS